MLNVIYDSQKKYTQYFLIVEAKIGCIIKSKSYHLTRAMSRVRREPSPSHISQGKSPRDSQVPHGSFPFPLQVPHLQKQKHNKGY